MGDFKDKDVALIYCARFIAKNFLLSGQPNSLIPDRIVRVSVKSLALSCLSTILEIYPQVLLKYLDKSSQPKALQQLSDVFLYATHSDPQLRGAVRILIASFVKAALISGSGRYDWWIGANNAVKEGNVFIIEGLVEVILKVSCFGGDTEDIKVMFSGIRR